MTNSAKREHLAPESIGYSIKGDLIPQTQDVHTSVGHFLDNFEMPAGVVRNLQAAQRELSKATLSMHAALTVAELIAFGDEEGS